MATTYTETGRHATHGAQRATETGETTPCQSGDQVLPKRPVLTGVLNHQPFRVPAQEQGNKVLSPNMVVLLQMLPSGTCAWLTLETPLVLGRNTGETTGPTEHLFDLTPFNAEWHGVSRRHSLLRRTHQRLTITDLGSTNGTYLNGERLEPHQPVTIADGDHLIVGTLHIAIFFVPSRAQGDHR